MNRISASRANSLAARPHQRSAPARLAVPFHRPDITAAERAAVEEVLGSGWLTTGRRAAEFEAAFAAATAAPHAVAVSSCTAALHLALDAAGVGPGDEVLVPAMTFTASASTVVHQGARPVLVDICADDHTVDPEALERAITPATRAIVTVDFAGQPARMAPILALARDRGLPVIEDAAHAFPAAWRGRPVGSIADVTCFSFYATKTLTTGEGGMATALDAGHAQRIRLMANHGISRSAHDRAGGGNAWYYEVLEPGWKYNMPDLTAALGLVQLARAEEMRARRQAIAEAYSAAFADEPALEVLGARPECRHSWHLFVVKLRPEMLTIDRDRAIEELKARGIGTSVHFIPLNLHPWYRDRLGARPEDCPVAVDCFRRSISLPIWSAMGDAEVGAVIEAVKDVLATFRR